MARTLFHSNNFIEESSTFLLMGLLSIALLIVDHNTTVLDAVHKRLESPLLYVYNLVHRSNNGFVNGYLMLREHNTLVEQINDLQREKNALQVRYQLLVPQLEQENKQLRDLLKLGYAKTPGVMVAEQVRGAASDYRGRISINLGSKDTIRLTQPVLSSRGLVGQVDEIFPHYGMVLPIIHPSHAMSVQVKGRSGRYIAKGDGRRLVIDGAYAQFAIDDKIITTGLGGIYPQFYPVGRVTAIKKLNNDIRRVLVEPYTDFAGLRFMLVIYQLGLPQNVP